MSQLNENVLSAFLSVRHRITGYLTNMVPPKDVEDIVQETYVKVCQVTDDTVIRHPRSFLLKTAKNLALDHIKSANVRLVSSADEEQLAVWHQSLHDIDETYRSVAAKEEFSDFCEAVRKLPQQCRRVFVLKKVYGYSQQEIAEELDLSESTVEKHIALGIRKCRAYMIKHADPGEQPTGARGNLENE